VEVTRTGGTAQVELGTGAGDIDRRLPQDASARLVASTNLGRVDLDPAAGARYNGGPGHLESMLGDGRGSVGLRTGKRDIPIHLTATP